MSFFMRTGSGVTMRGFLETVDGNFKVDANVKGRGRRAERELKAHREPGRSRSGGRASWP
ncbi:hypothetical protein GCM10008937_28240 [Deinococcus depolymerans]|uniref:Uncharacterized protein n=1 Tax=Deinococcus depolymerans TaxID=392408 RepID=A0ABN1CHX8_9DEIO